MRRVEELTMDRMPEDTPEDIAFLKKAAALFLAQEAIQNQVAKVYGEEIERRLMLLNARFPRHTFEWVSGMGTAYVSVRCNRGGEMARMVYTGFLGDSALRAEEQFKNWGGNYVRAHRLAPTALAFLWEQVEAIMTIHVDSDETFNIAI